MFRRFIAAVLAAASIAATWPQAASAGDIQHLSGLQGPVTLTRDTNGIMHIRAQSEPDLFFMQGWLHARDRLFQMDTDRPMHAGSMRTSRAIRCPPSIPRWALRSSCRGRRWTVSPWANCLPLSCRSNST